MAGLILRPRVGRVYGTGANQIEHFPVASGATPKNGDMVVLTAGEIVVAASDAALFLGLVTSAKEKKAGYGLPDNVTQVQDRDPTIGVQIANGNTQFAVPVSVDGNVQGIPAESYIGKSYGTKLIGGIFMVNIADTAAPTVTIVDVDILTGTAFIVILPANRQQG